MNKLRIAISGLLVGAMLTALIGCAHAPRRKGPGPARFDSARYDVAMVYPATLKARHGFASGYFLQQRWNPDAAPGVPGQGLLTLTLPQSNKLTTGELRLGVSDAR